MKIWTDFCDLKENENVNTFDKSERSDFIGGFRLWPKVFSIAFLFLIQKSCAVQILVMWCHKIGYLQEDTLNLESSSFVSKPLKPRSFKPVSDANIVLDLKKYRGYKKILSGWWDNVGMKRFRIERQFSYKNKDNFLISNSILHTSCKKCRSYLNAQAKCLTCLTINTYHSIKTKTFVLSSALP